MAKFLQRLFSGGSSSSKRSSLRASHTSVHESSQRTGALANMRAATSLESLASYNINPRELEKNKLHKASWEGDIHKVERLARPGLVDHQDQQSRTPLHMAVARGHLSIVQRLVREGARLNLVDKDQRTPLVKAVLSGNHNQPLYYQICIALLKGGADAFINAVDNSGKNALHYSIEYSNEELVDLFLSFQNCDPNFRDRDQMTPLHLAVIRNSPNIVDILLSDRHTHQADPNLTNRNGQTSLHMAASLGYADIIQVILQSNLSEPCDPTILDIRQLTAYQVAKENHHDECAKLIDEYQHGWTKLSPRRNTLESINEHEINPMIRNPAGRFRDDDEDDDESESTTSDDTNQFSKSSPRHIQQQPSNQWLNRTTPAINQNKQETYSLADLIKKNPLQPDSSKTYETKPNNQTLSNLVNSMPLKPDESRTHVSKPNNQTLSNLMHNIPLQPDEKSTNKSIITPQKQPPSIFGIGPTILQREDTDNTSTSMSIEKPSINKNLIGGPTLSSKKNVTISSLIQSLPQPESNDSNSWTYDKSSIHKQEPITKPATRIETSDDTSLSHSDDDDDNVGNIYRTKTTSTNFPKPTTLNHTSGFTTTRSNEQLNNTDSDEDSIEAAVRQINTQKPSFGIQNLVNQQIGNNFKTSQQIPISNVQSPITEDYLYTTSSIGSNKESTTKGISNLVQHQPLISKKTSESTWDDSRPLSADLERNSIKSKTHTAFSSSDSDTDQDQKSATIVRSPVKNGVIANFIQTNMRPTQFNETKPTGVENLIKIIDDIKNSPPTKQNQSIPQKTIGTLITSSMIHRSDSLSSDASSVVADSVRTLTMAIPTMSTSKSQLYHDEVDKLHWPSMTNDRHDFKHITDKYSNEIIPSSQRQSSRTLAHHEFNSLRGSMSSSTSSIQNNMERLSELKEDIKQIERKQEDSLELKRQLKDMEIKKNNFEALYKKNDQLLRETETKLEKEINEKQRLEWATKNLNMELKSVKQKLQSLEEEKDILNQRCVKLKEERDNYDEKLRIHQVNSLQSVTAAGVLREEDIEKIKLRHREEMKLLSAENDDLHQRTKQLQSDLQLHKESLDVTIRYKIDLEKALEEKTFLQHELNRLKHEKDLIEQEKIDFKTKYDNLQEEIRLMLLDRSKLEQKLTNELQEQMKQRQRSTDDIKKYKTQIEQLNIKLGDAEARLLVLQTQNEALLASKDRDIKNEFDTLTQRLNIIESEKLNAEQRFHNEQKDITNKQQQHVLHEPLVLLTSTPLNNALQQHHQHSPSSPCVKCDTLQRSYEHEREQRIQTEKDNERLRDVVSRQKQQNDLNKSLQQHQEYEHNIAENSKQIRSETDRVKHELDRLRHDFDKLVSNYDSPNNLQQQAQLHSQIDTLRQFYEQQFRQQLLSSKLTNDMKPPPLPTTIHHYHRTSSPIKHDEYEHSLNGNSNCLACSNSRLLKERLENAIDTSLADQRIQTIKQMPILPRLTSPLLPKNNNTTSSLEVLRKRYHV